jgi:hypothetical protein
MKIRATYCQYVFDEPDQAELGQVEAGTLLFVEPQLVRGSWFSYFRIAGGRWDGAYITAGLVEVIEYA